MPENPFTEAAKALGIDVPVLYAEHAEEGTTLYLYGGEVVHWRREEQGTEPKARALGFELTTVWGIGAKTAAALRRHGIGDVAQLIEAQAKGELGQHLRPATLTRVRQWLKANGYL